MTSILTKAVRHLLMAALSLACAGSVWAADGKGGFRLSDSSEFPDQPTKSEVWNDVDGPGAWAYWKGKSLDMEAIYHGAAPGAYLMRTYMHVDAMLTTSFKWINEHRVSIVWSDPIELEGSKGPIETRRFTINDGVDYHCIGFMSPWGRFASGVKHVVAGYICSASSGFPLGDVLPRHLYALGLDGKFDHFLAAP